MQERDDGSFLFSPTDLVNFLGCSHSTVLDLRALSEPLKHDDTTDTELLLRRKGNEHESKHLQSLKSEGKSIAEIPKDSSLADRIRMTKEAMRKGADVVF